MATGERFRAGGARGIAQFLSEHQHCDDGFDVQRGDEAGSGRLRITCLGCGQSVAYKTGEPGEFVSPSADAVVGNGSAAPAQAAPPPERPAPDVPPAHAPRRIGSGPPGPPPGESGDGPRLPRWLPAAVISLVIVAGIAMIAIGLLRSDDDEGGPGSEPVATQPAETEPAEPTAPSEPAEPPAAEPPAVALQRRTVEDTFAIGLPRGWGQSGDPVEGFTFAPQGAQAGVSVFFEQGERGLRDLAGLASGFLEQRHPGARVSGPRSARLASGPALAVTARYPGGIETAVVLTRGGFSFLVLERADRGADSRLRAEADAVASSFRPL